MSASRPASMSAWSQLSPSTGYGDPVIRTVVAAGLGSSLVLFGGLHTLSPHIIAQAGLPPSSTPKRLSRPLSVPLYPVPSPSSATPPSATPRHTLSADIMGNCHSKSDDDRHGGRDGYSSSTEKLNPRPYNHNNPNNTINYTKNKIVINVPPGQATGSQRPGQATVSQRQQQPQFSSPPKGKRRRPSPDLKPEYYLHISCRTCDGPDKRGGRRCATAWDMNLQNPMANRDPQYRGRTPRDTWYLEVDFCDTLTSLLATQATSAKAGGKEKGKKTPQEVLGRYVRDADLDPKVIPVDELLDALRKGEVKFTSSL